MPCSQDEDQLASDTAEHVQSAQSAGASEIVTTHGQSRLAASQEAASRQANTASTSGRGFNSTLGRRSQEREAEQSVADKLIAVFASKSPAEWRKLIAFSKQWPTLADRQALSCSAHSLIVSFFCRVQHVCAYASVYARCRD